MDSIIHRIRLHEGVSPSRFESWVRDVDYAACPKLPSVLFFSVHRYSVDPDSTFHYFEIIGVTNCLSFEKDMQSETFQGLATDFASMASVVDEFAGERIDPGYPSL